MKFEHAAAVVPMAFDDATRAARGLAALSQQWLRFPTDKGAICC